MHPFDQPMISKEVLDKVIPPIEQPEFQMPENIEVYYSDSVSKMTTFQEMEDEFIIEHLVKYANGELYTPEDKIHISKKLIMRALTCFKKEHPEEWKVLNGINNVCRMEEKHET